MDQKGKPMRLSESGMKIFGVNSADIADQAQMQEAEPSFGTPPPSQVIDVTPEVVVKSKAFDESIYKVCWVNFEGPRLSEDGTGLLNWTQLKADLDEKLGQQDQVVEEMF